VASGNFSWYSFPLNDIRQGKNVGSVRRAMVFISFGFLHKPARRPEERAKVYKWDDIMMESGTYWICPMTGAVVGFYEHSNESLGSIKDRELFASRATVGF
jgi:hypothetical protein